MLTTQRYIILLIQQRKCRKKNSLVDCAGVGENIQKRFYI